MKPTEIKVGITSLRSLRNGRVIIEGSSKKEIETLEEKIGEQCGEELEVKVQRLGNRSLVMLNIPDDTTLENVRETLTQQNPELGLKYGNIEPKFCYTTKRGTRNLVIELDSGSRNKLLQTIVKMGWTIRKIDDYIVAKNATAAAVINITIENVRGKKHVPCAQKITS